MRASAFVVLFSVGCAPDEPVHAFVAGEGPVFAAIVGDDTSALAYRCDGDEDGATDGHWFSGPVTEGSFDLVGPAGTVSGTFGDDNVVLRFDDGDLIASSVDPADDYVGLFRGEGELDGLPVVAGWILAPSGEQRGAIGLSTSGTLFGVQPLASTREGVVLSLPDGDVSVDVVNAAAAFGP